MLIEEICDNMDKGVYGQFNPPRYFERNGIKVLGDRAKIDIVDEKPKPPPTRWEIIVSSIIRWINALELFFLFFVLIFAVSAQQLNLFHGLHRALSDFFIIE